MLSHLSPDDTIAALASAPGGAARGIVRVSGRDLVGVLRRVFIPDDPAAWNVRQATRIAGTLKIDNLDVPLPSALYLWPGKRSYTGEPLAELHMVGSPPLLEATLATLSSSGARLAQPGEFTLRAFLAGRIDLLQAEGVLGVIDADSTAELKTALAQLAGGASDRIGKLRGSLLDLLADLEAGLDFADEKLEFVSHSTLIARLREARAEVTDIARGTGERLRQAPRWRVTLAGAPNAGKSTLFNALVGRQSALVSELSGTTRDYLEAEITLQGLPVILCDTAGESAAETGIDREAQDQRQRQWEQADLILWCSPADDESGPLPPPRIAHCPLLVVHSKIDLSRDHEKPRPGIAISAHSGFGLTELRQAVVEQLQVAAAGGRQFVGTTAARCAESLRRAAEGLDRALAIADVESDQVLLALEIRDALDALGEIVGAVYTDDLLDRVFSRFCIGK